jgi:hypothetical protein
MPRFTFRFGEFEGDEPLPHLSRLQEVAENNGIFGPSGEQRGAYKHHLGNDFFYMEFVKEVPENVVTLEDGDFQEQEIARARVMEFLLFEDRTYGFESRRGVYDSDVFAYLLEDYEADYSLRRYESLSLDTMRQFYKNSTRVKKIKAEVLGEYEPNPHVTDEEVRELTEDFGQHSKSIVASVGRKKEDLKQAILIEDGIARYSDLSMIKSVTSEGSLRKLRDSGRFDFGVASDLDESEQAQEVRDTVSSFVRNIISNDTPDDDDDDDD